MAIKYTKSKTQNDFLFEMTNPSGIYQADCVNWGKTTKDTKEFYTEIMAALLLNVKGISIIPKNKTYKTPSHNPKDPKTVAFELSAKSRTERFEEAICKFLFLTSYLSKKPYPYIGNIIDFQTPINDGQKHNNIDLISNKDKDIYLLEVKNPDNKKDTILHCILQVYTYYKQIDGTKLLSDFGYQNYKIKPSILVFENSFQHQELKEAKAGDRPKLKQLIEELNVKLFIIKIKLPKSLIVDYNNLKGIVDEYEKIIKNSGKEEFEIDSYKITNKKGEQEFDMESLTNFFKCDVDIKEFTF